MLGVDDSPVSLPMDCPSCADCLEKWHGVTTDDVSIRSARPARLRESEIGCSSLVNPLLFIPPIPFIPSPDRPTRQ